MDLIGVHPVKHSDLGFSNKLFGGKLLYWLDADAAAYAMEVSDTHRMVTVSLDKCVWKKPSIEGHVIKIYANVVKFGRSSVTLNVEARRHNVENGEQEVILATEIKFVKLDKDGNSVEITSKAKNKQTHKYGLHQI